MNIGNIVARLGLDSSGFTAGLTGAGAQLGTFQTAISGMSPRLRAFGIAAGIAGGAVMLGLKGCVDKSIEFETAFAKMTTLIDTSTPEARKMVAGMKDDI